MMIMLLMMTTVMRKTVEWNRTPRNRLWIGQNSVKSHTLVVIVTI